MFLHHYIIFIIATGVSKACHCFLRQAFHHGASRLLATQQEDFISNLIKRSCYALSSATQSGVVASSSQLQAIEAVQPVHPCRCQSREEKGAWLGSEPFSFGSVSHKNTINNINHPATQIRSAASRTKERVSLTCHHGWKDKALFNTLALLFEPGQDAHNK